MRFIKKLVLGILASGIAFFITAKYFPGYITIEGDFFAFGVLGIVFGILNYIIKPIIKLISLPFMIITLGLFVVVINALIIFLIEYFFNGMPSLHLVFDVKGGFLHYVIVALVLSVINSITHWFVDIK